MIMKLITLTMMLLLRDSNSFKRRNWLCKSQTLKLTICQCRCQKTFRISWIFRNSEQPLYALKSTRISRRILRIQGLKRKKQREWGLKKRWTVNMPQRQRSRKRSEEWRWRSFTPNKSNRKWMPLLRRRGILSGRWPESIRRKNSQKISFSKLLTGIELLKLTKSILKVQKLVDIIQRIQGILSLRVLWESKMKRLQETN